MKCEVMVKTKDMAREEWLRYRRNGVGGSDAAAIIGLNANSSAYSVWADKRGLTVPKPDNEPMRQGRDLEAYVACRWSEATGKRVKRRNAILVNPKYPFAFANVDRLVIGENAGLECKTTQKDTAELMDGKPFDHYYVQCMHYMAVTGADRWYLGVLVLGREFYEFTIERNEDEINSLMEAEQEFWERYVCEAVPPEVDGSEATSRTLKEVYSESFPMCIELEQSRDKLLDEYIDLKAQESEVQQRLQRIEQTLQNDLKESEVGKTNQYIVEWKRQERNIFDTKRFQADSPDIYKQYKKLSISRRFTIKEIRS